LRPGTPPSESAGGAGTLVAAPAPGFSLDAPASITDRDSRGCEGTRAARTAATPRDRSLDRIRRNHLWGAGLGPAGGQPGLSRARERKCTTRAWAERDGIHGDAARDREAA